MPNLWVSEAGEGVWRVSKLDGEGPFEIRDPGVNGDSEAGASVSEAGALLLRGKQAGAGDRWLVLACGASSLSINGFPLGPLGVHVLRHRDEIRSCGTRIFFSTEESPKLQPFPGFEGGEVPCRRCGQPISVRSPSVCCPACKNWYHQAADRPCWTYGPTCLSCHRKTSLDGSFSWTPEEL